MRLVTQEGKSFSKSPCIAAISQAIPTRCLPLQGRIDARFLSTRQSEYLMI
jgi:hypothetical protein